MFGHQGWTATARRCVSWLLGLLATGLFVLSVSGCNTMSGMGQDVKAAGSAVSDTAQKTEEKM
jgi:predicted small secreted protein